MNTFTQRFDNSLDAIQSWIMSLLTKLGPFFVALMPASFTAYAIFHTFKTEAGFGFAFFFAAVVGTAIETVGIVATHTATDLYNAMQKGVTQPVKFWLMVCLIPVYIIGVALVVYFSEDAFTPLIKSLGIASPFLTCIVYIAVALARDLRRIETEQEVEQAKRQSIEAVTVDRQAEIEAEQRQWEREKERLELEQKHLERMERIRVKNGVKNVKHDVLNELNAEKQAEKLRNIETVLAYLATNPQATLSQIGGEVGVSKTTAKTYTDELIEADRLHKNGHGWEVLK
jgi:hypothetical protein